MKRLFTLLFILPLLLKAQDTTNDPLPMEERYRFTEPVSVEILSEAVLRDRPSSNSNIIGNIPKGKSVKLVGKAYGFYWVNYENLAGFVHFVFVDGDYKTFKSKTYKPDPLKRPIDYENEPDGIILYGKVNVESPLKDSPQHNAKTIFAITEGTILKLTQHNSSYWKTEINGFSGYLGKSFIVVTGKTSEEAQKNALTPRESEMTTAQLLAEVDRTLGTNYRKSTPQRRVSSSGHYYHRGPRGGCYYITSSGRKQYVDRSLCN